MGNCSIKCLFSSGQIVSQSAQFTDTDTDQLSTNTKMFKLVVFMLFVGVCLASPVLVHDDQPYQAYSYSSRVDIHKPDIVQHHEVIQEIPHDIEHLPVLVGDVAYGDDLNLFGGYDGHLPTLVEEPHVPLQVQEVVPVAISHQSRVDIVHPQKIVLQEVHVPVVKHVELLPSLELDDHIPELSLHPY